ncbi:MAG: hypothetical protein ACR2PI_20550 [Hyphomicrobiaceae bacterium]
MLKKILCFASSIAVLLPTIAHSGSEYRQYAKVRGWRISYNLDNSSCRAFSQSNSDRTHLVFEWGMGATHWHVVLYNPTWRMKPGHRIPGRVFVDRDLLLKQRLRVLTPNIIALPVAKSDSVVSHQIYREISDGNELRVVWPSGNITQFGLHGSRDALSNLSDCARDVKRTVQRKNEIAAPAPRPARRVSTYQSQARSEEIPHAAAQRIVHKIFRHAGYRKIVIYPSNRQLRNIVFFRLMDGRNGWFSAWRGQTLTADAYVARSISISQVRCNGTFGSQVKKVPSVDGSMIRTYSTACVDGDERDVIRSTVVRRQNGLLLALSEDAQEYGQLREVDRMRSKDGLVRAGLLTIK